MPRSSSLPPCLARTRQRRSKLFNCPAKSVKPPLPTGNGTENIASAKCELETGKALFTDYFNLVKTNDGWFIVDKVSTRVDKK